MSSDNSNNPRIEAPTPVNFSVGAVKGLLVAGSALILAAAAVLFFSVLQTTVPCEFRPVTYAIFTGIVIAAVGSILGGQAAIRGNLPQAGVAWTVTGGAAFLIVVMAAVWWVTRTQCKELATLRLSSIPAKYTFASFDPSPADKQLRVRFGDNVTVKQFVTADQVGYDLYFSENQEKLKIHLDLIFQNKSVQICEIAILSASPKIKAHLGDPKQFIRLTENTPVELRFRDGFVDELLAKYRFDKRYQGGTNSCVQIEYEEDSGKRKPALVDDIYFVAASLSDATKGDLSLLTRQFSIYARLGAAQPSTAVSDDNPEPPKDPPAITVTRPNVSGTCPQRTSQVESAYTTIMSTGVVGDDELKALYEGWCSIEQDFYNLLSTVTNSSIRYNLVRFIRSSITSIDVCWASSDTYRAKNPDRGNCVPKLNQPRDLSRPLPFATKADQKKKILNLLRDDNAPIRREVEALVRSYPHDEFNGIFDEHLGNLDTFPLETRQALASAAIGYYYNRVVEKQWADKIEIARTANADLERGKKWADKMVGPERGASRARLHYARAHVFLQVTGFRPSADSSQIRADFFELLKLSPEEMAAYPYPHHIARAVVYNFGKQADSDRFAKLDLDRLARQLVSTTDKFTNSNYEGGLMVVPDSGGTELAKLGSNDKIRVLMHFIPDPKKKTENAWDFVWTTGGVGWLKLLNKSS